MTTQTYWLAERDPRIIVRKVTPYHKYGLIWNAACPMMQTWYRNNYAYYSNVLDANAWDTSLIFDGEQGELVRMLVPEARSLVRQLVTLITKQQLNFQAAAEKDGSDVVMETRLGNAVARDTTDKQRLEEKGEVLAEGAFVSGMAFLRAVWRTDRGEVWSGFKDRLVYTGAIDVQVDSVADVLWNWRIKEWEDQPWVEVRTRKNRWDLIAQFPHLKQAILQLSPSGNERAAGTEYDSVFDDDLVDCYEVYCRPTPALAAAGWHSGRMLFYSDEHTIYYDGPNVYGTIPMEPMIPERVGGMMLGYPIFSNLLPCQEMLDHSMSVIATNQSAHAIQNVAVPRGAGVTWEELSGMNWFTYTPQNIPGGGKPEGINLTSTPKEVFTFMGSIQSHMQNLSNINAALRGNPPDGVTSGKAIATLIANSLEFMTSADKAYTGCMERTVDHAINGYRRFASVPRIVSIGGRKLQTYSKKFVGSDLDPIKSVKLRRVNPMLATIGGREQLAEMLLEKGMVKDVQHFMSILNGEDPVEAMEETELSEDDLIRAENEHLLRGLPVLGMNHHDHGRHFMRHMALLNDPAIIAGSPQAKGIMAHGMWHYQQAKGGVDPFLLAMARTGKIPEAPQQPPGQPALPPGPGGPPPGMPPGPPPGMPPGPPPGPGGPPPPHAPMPHPPPPHGAPHPQAPRPMPTRGGSPAALMGTGGVTAPGTEEKPATPSLDMLRRSG